VLFFSNKNNKTAIIETKRDSTTSDFSILVVFEVKDEG